MGEIHWLVRVNFLIPSRRRSAWNHHFSTSLWRIQDQYGGGSWDFDRVLITEISTQGLVTGSLFICVQCWGGRFRFCVCASACVWASGMHAAWQANLCSSRLRAYEMCACVCVNVCTCMCICELLCMRVWTERHNPLFFTQYFLSTIILEGSSLSGSTPPNSKFLSTR